MKSRNQEIKKKGEWNRHRIESRQSTRSSINKCSDLAIKFSCFHIFSLRASRGKLWCLSSYFLIHCTLVFWRWRCCFTSSTNFDFLVGQFFLASQSVNSFHCRIPNQIKLQSLVCFFLSTTDDHRYWLEVKASN